MLLIMKVLFVLCALEDIGSLLMSDSVEFLWSAPLMGHRCAGSSSIKICDLLATKV